MKVQGWHVAALAAALMMCMGAVQAQKKATTPGLQPASLIEKLDRNGNGCIDLEEGRNFSSRGFHRLDKNGDGVIEVSEFPPGGDTPEPLSLETWQDAYSAGFAKTDSNANGCLEQDEIEASRKPAAATGGH